MDSTNQPSPYFVRRTTPTTGQTIDVSDYSIVEDSVHPLRDYWLLAKRHRWLILTCAAVFLIVALLYAFTRTPLYTSEATLLIERKVPQILNLQDARGESDYNDYNNEFYKTQYEILKSRALAERVIRHEGLETLPLFGGGKAAEAAQQGLVSGVWHKLKRMAGGTREKSEPPPSDQQHSTAEYPEPNTQSPTPNTQDPIPRATRLAGQYLSMLEVRPVAGTSLVNIKFTTPQAALSARLANAHASSYVRYGIDLRSDTNSEASDFLQQKLAELKERIEQSEAALNIYRKEKGIISVDEKSNVIIERLIDLNKSLTVAEGERIAWEAQVRAARGRSAEEVPAVRSSVMIGALKGDLAKSEAEYASLAKEYKPGYPPLDNLKARIDDTRARLSAEIDREVKSIEAGYAAAVEKETQLRAVMDEQKRATLNLKDSAVQYTILAREVETNKQLYDGVLSRLKEIGVAGEVRSSNIYVMGRALPPGGPSYPDKRRIMMLGLLLGLAGGIGLAFLLDQLDNTLKTPEEAERYLRLPSLGMIPEFTAVNGSKNGFVSKLIQSVHAELPVAGHKNGKQSQSEVLLDHDPLSVVTEAYRSFRSALLLSQAGGPPHTMLVTSAGRGDGKTTTLVNTAIVFAQLGIRVVVVDADLRRPRCHMLLRLENKHGLSDLLAGQLELENAIRPTPAENLYLISAGAVPPNPAELLGSQKMHELLEDLRHRFEFVFIDSSPILAVADSVFLSTMVEGTLLVVNSRTPKPLVKKAHGRLLLSHSKVLGMLLNRVNVHNNDYGGYYQQYYNYYGDDKMPSPAAGSPKFVENGNGIAAHHPFGENGDNRLRRRSRRSKRTAAAAPEHVEQNGFAEAAEDAVGGTPSLKVLNGKPAEVAEGGANGAELPAASTSAKVESAKEFHLTVLGEQPVTGFDRSVIEELPADLPAEFLGALLFKLTGAMGPMAGIVLRDHVRALGASSESFPRAKLEELLQNVGKEIADDYHRLRFERELDEEIRKLALSAAVKVSGEKNGSDKPAVRRELGDSRDFLTIASANLVDAIGPIAPVVLRERLQALDESAEKFTQTWIEELIEQLSSEIPDNSARRRFQKEMAKKFGKK